LKSILIILIYTNSPINRNLLYCKHHQRNKSKMQSFGFYLVDIGHRSKHVIVCVFICSALYNLLIALYYLLWDSWVPLRGCVMLVVIWFGERMVGERGGDKFWKMICTSFSQQWQICCWLWNYFSLTSFFFSHWTSNNLKYILHRNKYHIVWEFVRFS